MYRAVRYRTTPSGTEGFLPSPYCTARYRKSSKKWFRGVVPQNHLFPAFSLDFYRVYFLRPPVSNMHIHAEWELSQFNHHFCFQGKELVIFGQIWSILKLYRSSNHHTAVCGAVPPSAVQAVWYRTANPHTARCGIPYRLPRLSKCPYRTAYRVPRKFWRLIPSYGLASVSKDACYEEVRFQTKRSNKPC